MPITSDSDEFEYRPHILIVDDDAAARLTIAASLHCDNYRVSFCCNGQEVKDRIAGIYPDVIICDLVMDGVLGHDLVRWLKASLAWRYVPIVAVTCYNDPVVRADLLGSGADAFVAKEEVATKLSDSVKALIRIRKQYLSLLDESDAPFWMEVRRRAH